VGRTGGCSSCRGVPSRPFLRLGRKAKMLLLLRSRRVPGCLFPGLLPPECMKPSYKRVPKTGPRSLPRCVLNTGSACYDVIRPSCTGEGRIAGLASPDRGRCRCW
jgi:hypothetical protein